MHRETTKGRGRSLMLLLLVFAAVALFGILAQQALALPTFTDAMSGVGPCQKCHTQAAVHAVSSHAALMTDCTNCHPDAAGAQPPLPSKCAVCHGPVTTLIATTPHKATGCSTTNGCHGYVAPVTATIAIDTVSPPNKVIKVKQTIKFSGGVTPVDTTATGVSWVVEMKSGSSWKQVKKGSATLGFLGGAMRFAYSYKPLKKGSFRTSASFYNLLGGAKTTSKAVLFKAK
jgi:hypothetical protein